MRADGIVIKVGGSVLAPKSEAQPRVDRERLDRLARELAALDIRPLVLVHGAGAFGHPIVQRTGLQRGLGDGPSRLAMGQTQRLQYLLDCEVADALLRAGLPVMPLQASALAVMREGRLEEMAMRVIEGLVDQGLIPLLYGVPALDLVQGCSILSGDVIAPHVARRLGIPRLVHATDVDGVFEADPHQHPDALRISRIDRHNYLEVRARLGGSAGIDVTGGMATKVMELVELARDGIVSTIVSGRIEGRITSAIAGHDVGTRISWGDA